MRAVVVLALALVAACGAAPHVRDPSGSIAGRVRDHDSGDPVARAEIRIEGTGGAPRIATSGDRGFYEVGRLAPGTYRLVATFAGQPIRVSNIAVRADSATLVDLVFTLGRPAPIEIDHGQMSSR